MARASCLYLLSLSLVGLVAVPASTRADDFYKGKTFTIIVGFSPGGGYDVNARGVARYIGKHIPGNPGMIVRNTVGVPKIYEAGLRLCIKTVLRLGIVVLGLTLSVKAIGHEVLAGEYHETAPPLNLSRSLRYLFDAPR